MDCSLICPFSKTSVNRKCYETYYLRVSGLTWSFCQLNQKWKPKNKIKSSEVKKTWETQSIKAAWLPIIFLAR